MKEDLKYLLLDRVNKYGLLIAALSSLFGLLVLLISVWGLPPLVPLFYNRPWGEPQLGRPIHLFLLLFLSTAIVFTNTTLALLLKKRVVLLSRILMWVSALVSLLVTTGVIRTIMLVK